MRAADQARPDPRPETSSVPSRAHGAQAQRSGTIAATDPETISAEIEMAKAEIDKGGYNRELLSRGEGLPY